MANEKGEVVKTEFTMGKDDYTRINLIMESLADDSGRAYYTKQPDDVKRFEATAKALYKSSGIRSAIKAKPLRDGLDKKLRTISVTPDSGEKLFLLEKFVDDLLDIRQDIGMGIPTVRRKSLSAQIAAGFKRR